MDDRIMDALEQYRLYYAMYIGTIQSTIKEYQAEAADKKQIERLNDLTKQIDCCEKIYDAMSAEPTKYEELICSETAAFKQYLEQN